VNAIRWLLDAVYPPTCVGCGRDPVRCRLCDHPTTFARQFCSGCIRNWPRVERVIALGYHAGALRRALHAFKYGGVEPLGARLGDVLGQRVAREVGGIDRVVAVPGGTERRRRRGFDPAEVVAQAVARRLAAPLESGLIARRRDGQPSASGRTRLDREVQVEGRFGCDRPGALGGLRVLLVDDVYTTGASLESAAKLLRDVAGARSVVGAVVGRTVLDAGVV
jgi:predicted amidophosphoribosyltransferase